MAWSFVDVTTICLHILRDEYGIYKTLLSSKREDEKEIEEFKNKQFLWNLYLCILSVVAICLAEGVFRGTLRASGPSPDGDLGLDGTKRLFIYFLDKNDKIVI